MKSTVLLAAALAAGALLGAPTGELTITADRVAADNVTGALAATGHVRATAWPVILHSESITRDAEGKVVLAQPTLLTTCTNELDCLHWSATGEMRYQDQKYAMIRNLCVRLYGVPVLWLPVWYYPMNTDYGWRVMPGYTSRWGAYLLTKYVYDIYGDFEPGHVGIYGSTRFDLRSENGIAIGQGLHWQLGDFGRGNFRAYYAWDDDYGRYDRHADTRKYRYRWWSSDVSRERYGLGGDHRWEATERDIVYMKAAYYSDSLFTYDFERKTAFMPNRRMADTYGNVAAWEHLEDGFGFGLSASGPLNRFYAGVANLPDAYFDVNPQSLFRLPVNYESQTRAGYYDRDYGEIGRTGGGNVPVGFRYNPGPWANYNAFRMDTYHRLTAPFRIADVVSAVPRAGVRGTYWSDTGRPGLQGTVADGKQRAGSTGDDAWRSVVEGGITFSARGVAQIDDRWSHVLEPYFDVLAQEANYSGLADGARPYFFDNLDGSTDWLDQFAGRSRNLPYSYTGVTPGLRNAFRRTDDGVTRTVFDIDAYCAIQFNDTDYIGSDRAHRLVRNPEDPNYGEDSPKFVPGVRLGWQPDRDLSLAVRAEYDDEKDKIAYGSVSASYRANEKLRVYGQYHCRNQRRWDYASTDFVPADMKDETFNWAEYQFAEIGFEQDICDAIAWSPYVRWDLSENELDEIGAWMDYRTDCLGFRFYWAFEENYERVDRSTYECDFSCGFFIYLRALGPGMANPLSN